MIVVDASVLIAHFTALDVHHTAAEDLLVRLVDDRLCAHPLTITEMLVGAARNGRALTQREDIRDLGVEQWRPDDEEPLRLAELRATTGLKLPDCCVLSAALSTDRMIATFDQVLSDAAQRLGIRTL